MAWELPHTPSAACQLAVGELSARAGPLIGLGESWGPLKELLHKAEAPQVGAKGACISAAAPLQAAGLVQWG